MSSEVQSFDDLMGRVRRERREIVTPDGVPLRVDLADPGERYAAFAADFFITLLASCLIEIAGTISVGALTHRTLVISAFIFFIVRTGYFSGFEIRWAGVTPGKRMLGLRVIDRRGGPLLPGAVIARNLTREAEFFYPITMVLATRSWARAPWEAVVVMAWILLMMLLPFFSRERLRAGDLLGGTIVIAMPKLLLLEDLVRDERTFAFTEGQLQYYGIAELQVLEDVLRRSYGPDKARLQAEICAKIQRRIEWEGEMRPEAAGTFLRDFYAAQRAFLERRKNLGDERTDKRHRERKNGQRMA